MPPLLTDRPGTGDPSDARPRPLGTEETFQILAVCEPGRLEERLRATARSLGQNVHFARSFPDGLDRMHDRLYDIVVVSKTRNGMLARDFVREAVRLHDEVIIVIAAPSSEYDGLIDVMVEGAHDFLPSDADDHQLKRMLGRAMESSQLRRRSRELEQALNARTESLRRRVEELGLLNEMTHELSGMPDLDELLHHALGRIVEAFDSTAGSFLIYDAVADELVVRAAVGPGADELAGRTRKLGEGVAGKVARDRSPVLVTDVEHDSRFQADALGPQAARHYRSGSFIAVPLVYHERLLGEMNIAEKHDGGPFTPDDLRLLSILGGHVAAAVNGALAAEELKRANERLKRKMWSTRASLRASHEKLTEARGLADAVAHSLPAAAAAFDARLSITYANETARHLLGLTVGGSLKGHPAGSGTSAIADAAAAVVDTGRNRALRTESRLSNSRSDRSLKVLVTPLRRPDGEVSGGVLVATPAHWPPIREENEENPS
jgi:nitrate/nitrite-specific signal transduction histidine kinase